jgi:hypothetical protein
MHYQLIFMFLNIIVGIFNNTILFFSRVFPTWTSSDKLWIRRQLGETRLLRLTRTQPNQMNK